MATIQKRKNGDGSTSFVAWVRVRPYKPTARAFPDRKAALTWADALERELRRQREHGVIAAEVTQLTVADLVRQFLDDPATKSLRYYGDLEPLVLWWVNSFGAERVLRFNVLRLREARARLQPGRAPATVNRYLSAMRSCWNWGRAAGLVPQDFLWPARLMMPEPRGRTRYLDDDETQRLLKASAADSAVMHAAVLVSLGCGVRQGELLRLNWSDVDLEKRRLRLLLTKNRECRAVHLPPTAAEAMRALKRSKVAGTLVFVTDDGQPLTKTRLGHRWKLVRAAAQLNDFRWHDLRHSCASFLAQKGANLLEIGSVLGHKSTNVTKRYAHLVEGAPVTGHTQLDDKLRGLSR